MDRISFKDLIIISVVLSIYVSIRLSYIDIIPQWDSGVYYNLLGSALNNNSGTILSFLQSYNLAGHISFVYAILVGLGLSLFKGSYVFIQYQNILLASLAICAFYRIVSYLISETSLQSNRYSEVQAGLYTFLFAFNPLFFGCSIGFNLDFPILAFLTIMTYHFLYGNYARSFLFGFLLVFTKAIGALLYGSFLTIIFCLWLFDSLQRQNKLLDLDIYGYLTESYSRKDAKNSRKTVISNNYVLSTLLLLPVVLWVLFVIVNKGELWGGGNFSLKLSPSNETFQAFGLKSTYIYKRILQIFVMNFNWLMTLCIIASSAFGLYRYGYIFTDLSAKSGKTISPKQRAIIILAFLFLVYASVNSLFITYLHPRYVIVSSFFIIILFASSLSYLFKSTKLKILIVSILCVLSFIQTFHGIDPITFNVFETFQFGNNRMIDLGDRADELTYNSEFTNIERLLNKTFSDVKLRSGIILVNNAPDQSWVSGISFVHGVPVYLDATTFKRTLTSDHSIRPNFLDINSINFSNAPQNAYYIDMPWVKKDANETETLKKIYHVTSEQDVCYYGYCLTVSAVSKKMKTVDKIIVSNREAP